VPQDAPTSPAEAQPLEDGQVRLPATTAPTPNRNRLLALLLALPPLAVLSTAAWLTPNTSGMETHKQLGLPSCGFYHSTGYPCPSCGMTTAFAHAAHGHLWQSFVTQPAGFVLAVACAMVVLVCGWSVYSGMNGAVLVGRTLARKAVWMSLLAVILLAWGWVVWQGQRG
jgi:hypothetical protein